MIKIKIFTDDSLRGLEERSNFWLKENSFCEILHTNFQTGGPRNSGYVFIITYKASF